MWLFFALGSAFFAGITAVLAKIGIENVNSTLATALRTVVVLAFSWLMVFVVGSQGGIAQISGTTLLFLMLSGLSTGASWLCYFKALQLGDVNKVAPIDKSSTVLTILLAFIFLGEPVSIPQALGVVGIGVGTLLMIAKKEVEDGKPHSKAWLVYAFLSAVFASLTSIFGKIGVENVESNLGTAIRTIVVLVMAWVMVFVTGEQKGIRSIGKKSWVFLFLSGITTGLSWLCYYRALQDGPASVVVPIDKLSILVTIVFSWIVLKEKLTPKAAVGLVLILAGMVFCERFFCRFLCPMGAVFTMLPVLPFFSVRRQKANCAKGCTACQKSCPSDLELPEKGSWNGNGDCFQCQKCLEICPKKNAESGFRFFRGNEIWFAVLRAVILAAVLILAGI